MTGTLLVVGIVCVVLLALILIIVIVLKMRTSSDTTIKVSSVKVQDPAPENCKSRYDCTKKFNPGQILYFFLNVQIAYKLLFLKKKSA